VLTAPAAIPVKFAQEMIAASGRRGDGASMGACFFLDFDGDGKPDLFS